jgi:hypothetical protein
MHEFVSTCDEEFDIGWLHNQINIGAKLLNESPNTTLLDPE